jgi:hypothetical protein
MWRLVSQELLFIGPPIYKKAQVWFAIGIASAAAERGATYATYQSYNVTVMLRKNVFRLLFPRIADNAIAAILFKTLCTTRPQSGPSIRFTNFLGVLTRLS